MRWRPPTSEERQLAILWGVLSVSSILLRPLWLLLPPLLPPCPLRTLTGLPCPTCGTAHAAIALLDGKPLAALAANPLATLAGIGFLAGGLAAPLWLWAGGRLPVLPTPPPGWLRFAMLAALLAGWGYVIAVWR